MTDTFFDKIRRTALAMCGDVAMLFLGILYLAYIAATVGLFISGHWMAGGAMAIAYWAWRTYQKA